jgi:hypothetical protein
MDFLSKKAYIRDATSREAPARIVALTEMFSAGAPAAELLKASMALEEQIEELKDGKDLAGMTLPLLNKLLVLTLTTTTSVTPLTFKVSVARCMLLQLCHLWHYCHDLHLPFIEWVVQNLLLKNNLPDIQAACMLLTELISGTEERDQEADEEERSVNSVVMEAVADRLKELIDLDMSRLQCSDGAEAQELAEELLYLLELDGEPEPLDRVMGRIAAFFTTTKTTDLDLKSKLPAQVRDDFLDANCEIFSYVDLHSKPMATVSTEDEQAQAARLYSAVNVALAPAEDGGPSLFACILSLLRRSPEVQKNLLGPCKLKVIDFTVRLAIGILVAAAADDSQFDRAQHADTSDDAEDALYTVLRIFKLHRFHLYEGNDDQIFYHVNRTLRQGVRKEQWAAAVARTGPIYDDSGKYIDF